MDRYAFDLELKLNSTDGAGTVEGYGSIFGNVDRGGDVIEPGAFKASLADWRRKKQMPPILWQHDSWTPIGVWDDVAEDAKGLKVKGSLILDVPQAAVARTLMQAGAVKGLSIGYRTTDFTIDRKSGVRTIKKAELWEISLVTFPMNELALVTGVKSDLDARELERALRSDLNLSSAMAVKAVAIVKQHLRDGGDPNPQEPRDGVKDLLMSLRRAGTALD